MKVPLIHTTPPPEFGELKQSPEFHEATGMDRDFTYVPGFSELRRARDVAIAEVRAGKRPANTVPTLPLNFRWARCVNRKGEPDSRKVIRAGNRGYKAVTQDQVGPGKLLESLPAGASVAADGTIRQHDVQLMVATKEAAGRNEFQKRVRTESMSRGAKEGFEAALRASGIRDVQAGEPTIEQSTGQKVRAELTPKQK